MFLVDLKSGGSELAVFVLDEFVAYFRCERPSELREAAEEHTRHQADPL